MTEHETGIPYLRRTREIKIEIVADERSSGESLEDILRKFRIRLKIDGERVSPKCLPCRGW